MNTRTVLLSVLLALSSLATAADRPLDAGRLMEKSGLTSSQVPTSAAAFQFCCKNANNRACHASNCANCQAFCSGNMVIDPTTPGETLGR